MVWYNVTELGITEEREKRGDSWMEEEGESSKAVLLIIVNFKGERRNLPR